MKMMKFFNNPRLLLCLSMVIFGTIGLFKRSIDVSAGELALYRAILASLLIGAVMLITRQKLDFRAIGRELPLLLISGMAMGINWVLLFAAYEHTSVSIATISYYFAPVLVTLISPILFKERMTPKQIICFCMSTLGLLLIIGVSGGDEGSNHLMGVLLGLGAACFYATVVLLNKFIKNVAGIPRTFLQFLAAILVLAPYVALTGGISLSGLNGVGWTCLITVGVVHSGIAYCMYFSALKELPGQKAAILSYIDPLVAILASLIFLQEPMTLTQVVGGGLILGFTLWNEIGSAPLRIPTAENPPRRIAVIGYSGSGKSTLAAALGEELSLPVLHMDCVHWLPGWQTRAKEEKEKAVTGFLNENQEWIIDGNYSKLSFERRMEEADRILLLSFNRFSCLFRAYKRYRTYKGRTRDSITEGCEEKMDGAFIRWILFGGRTRKIRRRFRSLKKQYPHKLVIIRNQRELNEYLAAAQK